MKLVRSYQEGMVRIPHDSENRLMDELKNYTQSLMEDSRVGDLMKNQPSYLSTDTETWQVMVGLDCADGDDMAVFSVRLNDGPVYVIGSRPVDMGRYKLWKHTNSLSGHRMNIVSRLTRWFKAIQERAKSHKKVIL